jgi:hypothetical protein
LSIFQFIALKIFGMVRLEGRIIREKEFSAGFILPVLIMQYWRLKNMVFVRAGY